MNPPSDSMQDTHSLDWILVILNLEHKLNPFLFPISLPGANDSLIKWLIATRGISWKPDNKSIL